MILTHQGFDADHPAVFHRHFQLVMKRELVVIDGIADIAGKNQLLG